MNNRTYIHNQSFVNSSYFYKCKNLFQFWHGLHFVHDEDLEKFLTKFQIFFAIAKVHNKLSMYGHLFEFFQQYWRPLRPFPTFFSPKTDWNLVPWIRVTDICPISMQISLTEGRGFFLYSFSCFFLSQKKRRGS